MKDVDSGAVLTKAALSDTCTLCPVNTYQSQTGKASCIDCPAGTSTDRETGAVACSPCPLGYFSITAASSCLPAPPGTFVNKTGSVKYAACSYGTFSSETAADVCDVW